MSDELEKGDRIVVYGTVRRSPIAGRVMLNLEGHTDPIALRSEVVEHEHILRDDSEDFHCLCNNTPDHDGFQPCLEDGEVVEPVGGSGPGAWQGQLYLCSRCGRIIDNTTLRVMGMTDD